jgi:6-pyruvoyltetrahydropterin/6-carboxytetrahydropterin synthase
MKYQSTKVYGNDRGLSCCFRQWRATHSHCSTLHGYSIGIKLVFESSTLDTRNWCFDFGGLAPFKAWADYMFDHTTVIASDDPHLETFKQLARTVTVGDQYDPDSSVPHVRGSLVDLRIVPHVGCEKFAELAFIKMNEILIDFMNEDEYILREDSGIGGIWDPTAPRGISIHDIKRFPSRYKINHDVELKSVEVFEHAGNSATYTR